MDNDLDIELKDSTSATYSILTSETSYAYLPICVYVNPVLTPQKMQLETEEWGKISIIQHVCGFVHTRIIYMYS